MLLMIHGPEPVEAALDQPRVDAVIAYLEASFAEHNARVEPTPFNEAQARVGIFGRMMIARSLGEEPSALAAYVETIRGIDRICGPTADKKGVSPMQVYLGMMALTSE